ncbi:conserved exported hypothetical protein [Sulfurovum sp. enrichment culture clone C5]|uniref:Porin n=1 Tax=Sulfurovum sp. enrichment culture clone C5 TaxID=497650 RepID=A0A0S4XPH0_9BACT|nr:conserved exported hypothetical protein [Sulfurovum sp. enrichment culture clone C5]
MKKTLLLSIVASTMIFAGGDIAPVEPAVVAPVAPVAESGWKFSGQGVVYYQTQDERPFLGIQGNLFEQDMSFANAGIQLRATNDDLIGGIGLGVEVTGIGTLGLEEDVVVSPMQMAGDSLNGGYVSQLYLTYGMGNTSLKVGRQELPKALSPFAFSEDWNVFKNTFDAALVVNTDIPNTTLVGAWVRDANQNGYAVWNIFTGGFVPAGNLGEFDKLNENRGVWMLTAQNKSIENLTLTGSWYYADNFLTGAGDDLNILWADAQYDAGFANIGLQGGTVRHDAIDNTNAFGAKASSKFGIVNASLAYSHINDSTFGIFQVGGSGSVLYTDMLMEEMMPYGATVWMGMNYRNDNDKFVLRADADVLGGNLGGAFGYADYGSSLGNNTLKEFDLSYSTKINDDLSLVGTYAYVDADNDDSLNAIRLVARYNF